MSVREDAPTRKIAPDEQFVPTTPPQVCGLAPPLPSQIRHFTVLRPLGRGGMGVVLAAYDNELDRKVAIKLMHAADGGTEGRARLQREAQAMAKLAHPNIARVYEAGEIDGRVYIIMEFIQGETLRAWLRRGPHWREVLATLRQAGQGLAAAHAAGLIHRDFKPDNVMVGDDGFVRVLDFGLARAVDSVPSSAPPGGRHLAISITQSQSSLSDQLTEAGTRVGTPAYMSPEQFLLLPVGVASDQFSFCVALYEGLYGARPFKARTAQELLSQVEALQAGDPPRGSKVPPRLWPIVLRGLSLLPEDRWPSMQALLAELSREPGQRTRRWFAGVALAAAASGIGDGLAAPGASPCKNAASHFVGIWDDARKAEVREAFRAAGAARADELADRVEQRLDEHVGRWIEMHTDACEATHVRGEQSEALLDRRMECLQLRRAEVDALVDHLVAADADALERAVEAAAGLSRLDRCADADALMAAVPPPSDPAEAQRVADLRERLARVWVDGSLLGRHAEARPHLDALLRESQQLGYLPLHAEVLFRHALHLRAAGEFAESERVLLDAYFTAGTVAHIEAQADAAIELSYVTGYELNRFDAGMLWDRHAGMLLARLGPRPKLRFKRHATVGAVLERRGQLAEAREHLQRALDIAEADEGPDSLTAATAAMNLGNLLLTEEEFEGAEALVRRALAVFLAELGPDSLAVAQCYNNLGQAVDGRGHLVEARELTLRALKGYELHLDPEHPHIAMALGNLGNIALRQRDFAAAREYLDRALALDEKAFGPDDLELHFPLAALAELAVRERRWDDAEAHATRALGLLERAGGPPPPGMIPIYASLGDVALARAEFDAARRWYQQSLELSERILGPDHPTAAPARGGLGRAALGQDQPKEAVAHLTRALALFEAQPGPVDERADLRFALAEALRRLGDPGAEEAAQKALAEFTAAGQPFARQRTEVATWLAQRQPP